MRSKPCRREPRAKRFALLGVALVVLAACGTVYQPGDERKSCAELQSEIAANEARIAALQPEESASAENETLRPSGTLAFMPFAINRPGEVQRIEVNGLERRRQEGRSSSGWG